MPKRHHFDSTPTDTPIASCSRATFLRQIRFISRALRTQEPNPISRLHTGGGARSVTYVVGFLFLKFPYWPPAQQSRYCLAEFWKEKTRNIGTCPGAVPRTQLQRNGGATHWRRGSLSCRSDLTWSSLKIKWKLQLSFSYTDIKPAFLILNK